MTTPFKALLLGTCIATTASLLATTGMAQTTIIDTPQGNSVVVPDDALEAQPSGGFIRESDYPLFESLENYQAIADTLSDQGYSDIFIQREGPILTVTAQRAGVPTELVYSTANGRLVSVDGVETRADPEGSSAGDDVGQAEAGASDAGDDSDTPDTPGGDDGASEDSAGDDGADGGSDAGDGGADSGSDGSDGGDADGGSDGSDSDSGADGGSEGGGSDGGSDSNG